jgi:hypothetical protein
MASLKNPQLQIPGGFQYLVVETGWTPPPFSSLDIITQKLIEHRKAQAYLTAKNGWTVDPAVVIEEVKQYNVAVCVRNGWLDYIQGGAEPVPFTHPTPLNPLQKARRVAAGAKTIVAWIDEGAPTVSQELANKRAAVCTGGDDPEKRCPMNGRGGLESYFTVPASNAIRAQLERKRTMKLETPMDDHLGVCEGCLCPLPLKVWMPLENILIRMSPDVLTALHPNCWIVKRDAP